MGGGVEDQCASLLSFLRVAAVEGSAIPFETANLEVVTPDKALEAQRMEILRRDLPAHLYTGSLGPKLATLFRSRSEFRRGDDIPYTRVLLQVTMYPRS